MTDEQKLYDALMAVLDINTMLAKQNALIVQTLTLPDLIFKEDNHE
jgi:hypothetical protein